jgi:predicted RecA/RadA family phage recombinase
MALMKNFVQPGHTVTLTAPTGGVKSGDFIVISSLCGVCAFDAAEGENVEVAVTGVYSLPKAAEQIGQGTAAYWDGTAKNVTVTSTDNKLIGAAIATAASGDALVNIRLNGTTV